MKIILDLGFLMLKAKTNKKQIIDNLKNNLNDDKIIQHYSKVNRTELTNLANQYQLTRETGSTLIYKMKFAPPVLY